MISGYTMKKSHYVISVQCFGVYAEVDGDDGGAGGGLSYLISFVYIQFLVFPRLYPFLPHNSTSQKLP